MFYPVGQLTGMCAELTLKAHLVSVGFTKTDLAKPPYGHNLSHMLKKCVTHGLQIDASEANAILVIYESHRDHFYRYGWKRVPEIRQLPNLDVCIDFLASVIDRVSGDPSELRRGYSGPDTAFTIPDPAKEIQLPVDLEALAAIQKAIDTKNEWLLSIENNTRSKHGLPPFSPRLTK